MIECFEYCNEYGELSHSQKQAVISLLHKEEKDRLFFKNWRPISFLNVDYKIISKVISISKKCYHILSIVISQAL